MNIPRARAAALAALLAVVAPSAMAQATFSTKGLTVETALKAAQAALEACRKGGYQVGVAVSDRSVGASLLPPMTQLRAISARVAVAVAEQAAAEGLATNPLTDPIQQVYDEMWQPDYPEIEVV